MRLASVAAAVATVAVCSVGGLLNRVRGGWIALPDPADDNAFTHDALERVVYALPTAVVCAASVYLSRRCMRMSGMAFAASFALFFFSYFVGWGTWFSMGRSTAPPRTGAFDWLVGAVGPNWLFWRRWFTDFAGMSIRGLVQTAPFGTLLHLLNFGSEFLFCGIHMGVIYELSFDIPTGISGFETTGLGEFSWGWWNWLVLVSAILAKRRPYNASSPLQTPSPIIFYVYLASIWIILLVSCVFYPVASTGQADNRNRMQTVIGLVVSTVAGVALFPLDYYRMRLVPLRAQEVRNRAMALATVQESKKRKAAMRERGLTKNKDGRHFYGANGEGYEVDEEERGGGAAGGREEPLLGGYRDADQSVPYVPGDGATRSDGVVPYVYIIRCVQVLNAVVTVVAVAVVLIGLCLRITGEYK